MKNKIIKYENEEKKKLLKRNYFIKNFLVIKNLKINLKCFIIIIIIFSLNKLNFLKFNLNKESIFLHLLYKKEKQKVCVCTLGKRENKYAREFVEHYKKYGIDKIIIYDNNDPKDEKFETVLSDYIKSKYVEIKNFRGKSKIQIKAMNDCYKNNYKKYDWFVMVDMDEFIFLDKYKSIKLFLRKRRFIKCYLIHLNRLFHTDNNQLYYKNKSLFQRFPEYKTKVTSVKSIIRGNISNMIIKHQHKINDRYKACNGFGDIINQTKKPTLFKYYYFDHFYFKSTEEFIEKINRGDCYYIPSQKLKFHKIKFYFSHNEITEEKIKLIEKKTGVDLEYFKKILLKKKNKKNKI